MGTCEWCGDDGGIEIVSRVADIGSSSVKLVVRALDWRSVAARCRHFFAYKRGSNCFAVYQCESGLERRFRLPIMTNGRLAAILPAVGLPIELQ